MAVTIADCEVASARLQQFRQHAAPVPRIDGNVSDWQAACEVAAQRLAAATAIQFTVTTSDLPTARAAIAAAQQWHTDLFAASSRTLADFYASLARDGGSLATWGDIRQHADHVVIVGDLPAAMPRVRQWLQPTAKVLWLMTPPEEVGGPAAEPPDGWQTLQIDVGWEALFRAAVTLQTDAPVDASNPAAGLADQLNRFVRPACTVATLLAADAWDPPHDTTSERQAAYWLHRWNAGLERCADPEHPHPARRAVMLASDRNAATRQAMLWQTGTAPAVRLRAPATPTDDPLAVFPAAGWVPEPLSGETPLDHNALQIHLATHADPQASDRPADILLATADLNPAARRWAAIDLPIAMPGIDTAGTLVRGDGSVTLPLAPLPHPQQPLASPFPAPVEAIARLRRAVAAGTPPPQQKPAPI